MSARACTCLWLRVHESVCPKALTWQRILTLESFQDHEELRSHPLENLWACPNEDKDDPYIWQVTMLGPPATPYEGGIFFLDMYFSEDYPWVKPKVRAGNGCVTFLSLFPLPFAGRLYALYFLFFSYIFIKYQQLHGRWQSTITIPRSISK